MLKYIFVRITALVITLFIIVTVAFMVIRLMPDSVYDDPTLPNEIQEILNAKYHLDEPIIHQYYYFLEGIVKEGDWGTSLLIRPKVPVFEVLKDKIPISLTINLAALAVAIPIGIIAGIIAAINKNGMLDHVISFAIVICISVPSFIYASLMQFFLAFKLNWFPIVYEPSAVGMAKVASLALPVMALSFGPIARVARYLRAELNETLNSEFMLLARTKGLTKFQSTVNHGLRNSFLPMANIIIPMFANIMGGSLVIETIFSVPGVGGLMIDSINSSDHPLTIAILLFYSFISLFTILIVDLSYGIIDPRVRVGGKK